MGELSTVKDIESAIERLTTHEFSQLRTWLDQYEGPQAIDLQLSTDLAAGKLDDRIRRALAEHKAERTTPL
jgi:hypothetical protein